MKNCCDNPNIVDIDVKSPGTYTIVTEKDTYVGKIPEALNFLDGGCGDYISITFCANCGKIQEDFPIEI